MNKIKSIIRCAAIVADIIVATAIVVDLTKYGYKKIMKNKKVAKSNNVEAEFIEEVIPNELLKIKITNLENENRLIEVEPIGLQYINLVKKVKELWDIR